jgi:exonuclease SbcC
LAKEKYYESERDLPETSFEELEKEYGFISNKYNKLLEKGKRLTKVKDTFILVKERMDQDTNRPLIDAMEKYLKHLTQGSYNISEITSSLSLKIKNQNSANFPINLLSAGTKDSASLALRLSLAETIQGNDKGLLVLDDCLVDMDPIRKKSAIEMIKLFSKNHQVIFTTCNPDTAMELEGNIIKMNSITNKGGL